MNSRVKTEKSSAEMPQDPANPQETAQYISVMLAPLQTLAKENNLEVIAYLLGLAREEAILKSDRKRTRA